jgi:hypothetical protein
MTKEQAAQFVAWLNEIADYVPPLRFRLGQSSDVGRTLIAVANGQATCTVMITPAPGANAPAAAGAPGGAI